MLVGPWLRAARFPWRGDLCVHSCWRDSRDRRAVHRRLRGASRRSHRLRRPSRSSFGCGSLAFPAARRGLGRSCLQGADLRGPNRGGYRGFRPGFAAPPGLRPGRMTSSTRGPAWRVPGPVAPSASSPRGGRRMCSVQGIVDPLASPHQPGGRGADPLPGTCWGVLPDSSHGLLKDPLHRHPLCASTPGVGSAPAPPERGPPSRSLGVSQRALRSPGSRPVAFAPITFGPGMPLPESRSALAVSHDFGGFLRTRGAGLLHPAADHGVRLVSGSLRPFAPSIPEGLPGSFWKASAVSIPGDRQAGTRPPSGDWNRTNPIPRRPGGRAAPEGARDARDGPRGLLPGDGPFEPSPSSRPSDIRTRDVSVASRSRLGATSLRAACLSRHSHRRDALRSLPLTHSPVRFQGFRSCCPLVVAAVAPCSLRAMNREEKGHRRFVDLEAFVHA